MQYKVNQESNPRIKQSKLTKYGVCDAI